MKTSRVTIATILVLLLCLMIGFWLASIKPIWNDELYTQINTIDTKSYGDILFLRFEEGNSSPLFYLTQKGICDLLRFRFPQEWNGEWEIQDLRSQLIMRIQPNLCMSLGLALLFGFFASGYSFASAVYALLIALSSFMVWAYWAESRPYALWFLLSMAQSLVFLLMLKQGRSNNSLWRILAVTHLLLALSVIFGVIQIVIVSVLLWISGEKNWKRHLLMTMIPAVICLFYYGVSPHYKFHFTDTPFEVIGASLPKDRLAILTVYAIFVLFYFLQKKMRWMKIFSDGAILEGAPYLVCSFLMLAAAGIVVFLFKRSETPGQGFMISNRYFMYLAPVGILAVSLSSLSMVRTSFRRKPVLLGIMMTLAALLIFRAIRTYSLAIGVY
jgi:hypothetical protein